MHTVNIGSLFAQPGGESDGRPQAFRQGFLARQMRKHGLAGNANKDGTIGHAQFGQVAGKEQIVLQRFAKTKAWVEHDSLGADARSSKELDAALKEVTDLRHDIRVRWLILHGEGGSPHVHHNKPGIAAGCEFQHAWITTEACHIIDDVRASIQGGAGDSRFHGVDGDEGARFSAQGAKDGKDAPDFLIHRHRIGAWTGRFTANIEDVRALRCEAQAVLYSAADIQKPAAVRE